MPGIQPGQNLLEMGLMRLTGRGDRWVDVTILSGTGPNATWMHIATLVDVPIWTLTGDNFAGFPAGSTTGEYRIEGDNSDNTFYGNADTNLIYGERGADTLYGMGGDDRLYGGEGPDTLYGGDGDDYLQTNGSLDHFFNLIGRGDYAYGGAGNDTLLGSGVGAHLFGGAGDDSYDGFQIAYEFEDEGVDTVYHTHSRTLEDNVENLFLSWNLPDGTVSPNLAAR